MKKLFVSILCLAMVIGFSTSVSADKFKIGGVFTVKCYNANGDLKWEEKTRNLVTTAGLNALNDIMFHGTIQVATWYIGLIDDGETLAAADPLASHSGWTENTEYSSPAARGEWTEGAASSGATTKDTVSFPDGSRMVLSF